jgi:hypothetical protein
MSDLGGKFKVNDGTGEVVSASIGNKAFLSTAADDSTLEVSDGKLQMKDGGTAGTSGANRDKFHREVAKFYDGNLTASDAAGGILSVENTSGVELYVDELFFIVTTGSSAACTVDVGVGSGASTSYDTLMDGFSVETGTAGENVHRLLDVADRGTNGKAYTPWPAGEYITASMASGATSGLVGKYVIRAIYLDT